MKSLLSSLRTQSRLADRIIIADGSDSPIESILENFKDLPIEYFTVRPPSLPKQRNVCISKLGDSDEWVGFLDDDLVLEDGALENIEKYSNEFDDIGSKTLGGIALTINNQRDLGFSVVRNIFLLDKLPGGVFTKSGCPSAIRPSKVDLELEWVYGGATFWKKDVLTTYAYDEWFDGTGYFEDVDYSFRVSANYFIGLCSRARCFHYHHPVRKERMVALGEWQITGWWYFISKSKKFNKALTLWSIVGIAINNFAMGVLKPRSNRIRSFLGNIKGLLAIIKGRALEKKGFSK